MTIQLHEDSRPCPVCKKPGQRRVVELQPNYGELWRVVHDDGTVHEWDHYDSVKSLYKSRGQAEEDVICPVCQELGQIVTYRKDKIHKPFKYDYKILHGDKKQCVMEKEEHRNVILKYLGRYVEQVEVEKPQRQEQLHLGKTKSRGKLRVPRIMCPMCSKPGAVKYFMEKINHTVYEHRDEPRIEHVSPTTGKKFYTYRRCGAGKRKQKSIEKVVEKPKPVAKQEYRRPPQPLPGLELYECPKCQKFATMHPYQIKDIVKFYYMRHGPYPKVPRCNISITVADELKKNALRKKERTMQGTLMVHCPQCGKEGTLSKHWDITRTQYARIQIVHSVSQKHTITRQTPGYEHLRKMWEDTSYLWLA